MNFDCVCLLCPPIHTLYNLRHYYDLVRNLVQGAWLRYVRRLNAGCLGEADLDEFLFGSERCAWPPDLRTILRDVQKDVCLYCGGVIRDAGDIDHFIPWARYPLELGHNFVLAHAGCNRSKSDLLAAPRHLSAWHTRNVYYTDTMKQAFEASSILHDYDTTRRIVGWAYTQAEANQGLTLTGLHKDVFGNNLGADVMHKMLNELEAGSLIKLKTVTNEKTGRTHKVATLVPVSNPQE